MDGASQPGLSRCGSLNYKFQANYSLLITDYLLTYVQNPLGLHFLPACLIF